MITSERVDQVGNLYHEVIYDDGELVCRILSDYDTYCYVDWKEQFVYKGYATVADAKEAFFKTYD